MSIHKYELMISEVCNLQCKHCGMSYSINNANNVDYEAIKQTLINESKKTNIEEIYLWGGEPLLGDLDKILELMDLFPNAEFKVTTNLCYELTDKRKEILRRCSLLSTSFDVKIRFNNVKMLNLWYHNCKELLKEKNMLCSCTISSEATKIDPNKFINLFEKMGFTQYVFSPVVLAGRICSNTNLIPTFDEYNKFMMEVVKHKSPRNKNLLLYKIHSTTSCVGLDRRIVSAKGKIRGCFVEGNNVHADPNCFGCKNYKICGGKSPCYQNCLFSKKVYDQAIESYNDVYNLNPNKEELNNNYNPNKRSL